MAQLSPAEMDAMEKAKEDEPLLGRESLHLSKCDHRVLVSGVALCNSSLYAYIPLLPETQQEYHTTAFWMSVSLVLNWAGRGLSGKALWVPLSECSGGRRYPLVIGMTVFVVGTTVAGMTSSATMRLVGRLVQGIGAGSTRSLAEAIISDVYGGAQGDKSPVAVMARNSATASLGQTYVAVITLAPAASGVIMWAARIMFGLKNRSVSSVLTAWAIVQLMLYFFYVPETRRGLPSLGIYESFVKTATSMSSAVRTVRRNSKNSPLLISGLLWNCCTSGAYGAVLVLLPYTLYERFHLSIEHTSALIGSLGIAYLFGLVLARSVRTLTTSIVSCQSDEDDDDSTHQLLRGTVINLRIAMGCYTLVACGFAAIIICYAFHVAPQTLLYWHHGFTTLWCLLITLYAHECVWAFANLSVTATMLSVCDTTEAQSDVVATNNVLMVLGFVFSGIFSSAVAGAYNTYARPDVLYGILAGWSVLGSAVYWISLFKQATNFPELSEPTEASVVVAETSDRL